jgi:Lrp/AsnC family transcriptional regulator
MSINLDEIDRRLLRALQSDATLSMDVLAERVGLSRNACWRRVKLLEQAGVIRGRPALLDPDALGCPLMAVVLIRTNAHDAAWRASFERAINAMPQVVSAYRMTGDLDYMLRVRVADMAAYDQFYKALTARVAVSDISASFVMEFLKETTELPL